VIQQRTAEQKTAHQGGTETSDSQFLSLPTWIPMIAALGIWVRALNEIESGKITKKTSDWQWNL
jgi:hypothetical protein